MSRWGAALGVGAAVGATGSLADTWLAPGSGYELKLALGLAANALCVWAGIGVLAGWLLRRPVPAAAAGALSLVVAVLTYYALGLTVGDRAGLGWATVAPEIQRWSVAAVFGGPLLGLVGSALHRPGPVGFMAALALPIGAAVDMAYLRDLSAESFRLFPWSAGIQVSLIGLAILLAVASRLRGRRTNGPVFAHSEVRAVPEHVGWEQG